MRVLSAILVLAGSLSFEGCHTASPPPATALEAPRPGWPRTVNEAVTRILAGMSDADKARIRATKEKDLRQYRPGWGAAIRSEFGLWDGNKELLADCGTELPSDASMVIIEAVWQRLQKH